MKKIIIAVFLLSFTGFLKAQIPGYQGKRTVIEVKTMLPLAGLTGFNDNQFPLYVQVNAEYALQRKRSVSLEFRRLNITSTGTSSGTTSSFSHSAIVAMYGIYRKDWSLAPYGKYFNVGLGYNFLNGTNDQFNELGRSFISANIAWGQRLVLAKRFTFNYAFEMGMPLSGTYWPLGVLTLFNVNVGTGILF